MLQTPEPTVKAALVPVGGDTWGHGGTKDVKPGGGARQEELRNHFGFPLKRKGATAAGLWQGYFSVQDAFSFGEELSRPRTEAGRAKASLRDPAEDSGGSRRQLALRQLSGSRPASRSVCS